MLLLLVCLLVPGCNFVQFIWQGVISGLTIYAYVFFDVAVLLLASSALKTDAFPARAAARGAQLLLCLVILQNVPLSNQLCVKRDLELSSTLSAFTRILDQAEQTKGYVSGETPSWSSACSPLRASPWNGQGLNRWPIIRAFVTPMPPPMRMPTPGICA